MLEKDIVAAIMRHLKTVPDCFAWKTHGGIYGTARHSRYCLLLQRLLSRF